MKHSDLCIFPRCRQLDETGYLGLGGLCDFHLDLSTDALHGALAGRRPPAAEPGGRRTDPAPLPDPDCGCSACGGVLERIEALNGALKISDSP